MKPELAQGAHRPPSQQRLVMRREIAILIGPCPLCLQNAITLYSDGKCECQGVTKRAVFARRAELWDVSAAMSQPGALAGIVEQRCGYQASAHQCRYDIEHPYWKPHNVKVSDGGGR